MQVECIYDDSPRLIIDLSAIKYNYSLLEKKYSPSVAAAVLKSDAYGMGCITVSKCLYEIGCNDFFVVHTQDAIALRRNLGHKPNVYVLYGVGQTLEDLYVDLNFIPVLNTKEQVMNWSKYAKEKNLCLPAVFKVNTGMNRLGMSISDLQDIRQIIVDKILNIKYFISHLACGRMESVQNDVQLEKFMLACNQYFPTIPKSIAASNMLTLPKAFSMSMVRYGLNLYGAFPPIQLKENPLIFALRLEAQVLQIIELNEGDVIGYDASYVASQAMRIATLAIGYADGLPLAAAGTGSFSIKINGCKAPIVGAISMNLTTIDITNVMNIDFKEKSWITIIDSNDELYKLSEATNSSQHELLTRFGCIKNKRYPNS